MVDFSPNSALLRLKPGLKDKLGFATSDTGSRMIAAMLKFKGEEFVKKLK